MDKKMFAGLCWFWFDDDFVFFTLTRHNRIGNSPWDQVLLTSAKIGVTRLDASQQAAYIPATPSAIGGSILVPAGVGLAPACLRCPV